MAIPVTRSPSLMAAGRAGRRGRSRSGSAAAAAAGAPGNATALAVATVAVAVATAGAVVVVGAGSRPISSQLEIAGPMMRATRSAPTGRFSVSVVHQILSV